MKSLKKYQDDNEIWEDGLYGISNLTLKQEGIDEFIENEGIKLVLDHISKIINANNEETSNSIIPATRIIGNICQSDDDANVDKLLKFDVIPLLIKMTKFNKKTLQKEVLMTLSNIAAGTPNQFE